MFKIKFFRVLSQSSPRHKGANKVSYQLKYNPKMWQGASCAGIDTEFFYPQQDKFEKGEAELLKRICIDCPVMEACLEWGIAMERYGVWGATTPHERFAIRKQHGIMVNDPQHNP
jgi:WhiB family redox-sensing transcriptional regulator